MLYLALAEAALLLVAVLAFSGLVRSLIRQHARREDLLLNQMLNLAGKPWQPAPAMDALDGLRQKVADEMREQRRSWTVTPEQEI